VDALWLAGELPARPVEPVAVLVSRLRHVLGARRVVGSDAGYALHVDWLDVAALEELADEASWQVRRWTLSRTTRRRAAAAEGGHCGGGAAFIGSLSPSNLVHGLG
jgi:hypothetical protein